jgi:hypothetical protein
LIKGEGIVAYPDEELRLALQRSVAVEGGRGWKIAKDKASHKIDIVVALAQAAYAAVHKGQVAQGRIGAIGLDGRIYWHPN